MNTPKPGVIPVEPTPWPAPYKDRSAGLLIFGILTLLLGCLAGLFVPLMLFGQAAAARTGNPPTPVAALLPGMCVYGVLAVALIWLGIGSIMARRWARALLLIFSWTWLVMGVVTTLFMVFFMPKMLANTGAGTAEVGAGQHHSLGSAEIDTIMVIMLVVFGVLFVLLPAAWVFFYKSRHVQATCETRDPVTRWTDACPLPVLGFCLWLAFGVLMLLVMPVVGHGVFPFFGFFLSGAPGTLAYVVVAAVWGYCAWSLYKIEQRGWWLILIALCLFTLSSLLTYARHDITDMYRLMGYPEAMIEQMQKFDFLAGNHMAWLTALSMLPFLGYLLFIKKFLRPKS